MDLDDEAKRLAAAHPWAGTQPEREAVAWMPQHAVPMPPRRHVLTDQTIELQVAADIARMDRELDPHHKITKADMDAVMDALRAHQQDQRAAMAAVPTRPAHNMTATQVLAQRDDGMRRLRAMSNPWGTHVQDWVAQNFVDAYADPHRYTYVVDPAAVAPDPELEALQWRMTEKMRRLAGMYATGTPSWVGYDLAAPTPPKQRKTWIARLEQSKRAKR